MTPKELQAYRKALLYVAYVVRQSAILAKARKQSQHAEFLLRIEKALSSISPQAIHKFMEGRFEVINNMVVEAEEEVQKILHGKGTSPEE